MTMKRTVEQRVSHTFPPIYDKSSRLLILGSLPSVASREANFYYMHPQNRFWKVMGNILGTDLIHADSEIKKSILLANKIALHDVIQSCRIVGSGDASIKDVEYADIPSILSGSSVQKVLLNGQKAYTLFLRAFPQYADMAYLLPSTSPANAKCSLEELTETWKRALSLL